MPGIKGQKWQKEKTVKKNLSVSVEPEILKKITKIAIGKEWSIAQTINHIITSYFKG